LITLIEGMRGAIANGEANQGDLLLWDIRTGLHEAGRSAEERRVHGG
jgi:hypothetical protein